MTNDELIEWAWSKACFDRRRDGSCGHPACEKVEEATELIRALIKTAQGG